MTLADLLNVDSTLTYKGVTYKLRQPSQLEQGRFQRWLETRAREAVGRAVDLSPEAQHAQQTEVTRDIAAGVYEWNGEVCAKATQTQTGLAKLLSIILHDDAVTVELAAEMLQAKLHEIAAVLVSKATSNPKELGAALKMLGLPKDFLSSSSRTRRSTKTFRKSGR